MHLNYIKKKLWTRTMPEAELEVDDVDEVDEVATVLGQDKRMLWFVAYAKL